MILPSNRDIRMLIVGWRLLTSKSNFPKSLLIQHITVSDSGNGRLEGPDLLHFCQIYTQQQTPLDQEMMNATISFSLIESGPGCQGDI